MFWGVVLLPGQIKCILSLRKGSQQRTNDSIENRDAKDHHLQGRPSNATQPDLFCAQRNI